MWGNSLEVFLSHCVHENGTDIWTIGQDENMPPAMTTAGTAKDNILTVFVTKKKKKREEKKSQVSTFFCFLIFISADTVIHSSPEFCISRWVKQVNRHRKHCKPDRSSFGTVQYFRRYEAVWSAFKDPFQWDVKKNKMKFRMNKNKMLKRLIHFITKETHFYSQPALPWLYCGGHFHCRLSVESFRRIVEKKCVRGNSKQRAVLKPWPCGTKK